MEKSSTNCLGCRTFFQQNQALPLENITIEYKNFNIPLVQQKHKWTILKTIISFLNTKGGTIYIGVQDSNCQVKGKQLTRKARDEFKLALSQLIERVNPVIDLHNKEQLTVQFIPVVKNKSFSGKYITKVNVKQGDPYQTYSFVQKLQMIPEGKKESEYQGENIQIIYSFFRHNMGGSKEIKGSKLLEQAIKKAQNPPPKANTFHEQCNPEPPELEPQIKKIGFRNIGNRQARRKFEKVFRDNLQKLKIQFQIAFDAQLKAVIIGFPTVESFIKVNNFIKANLSFLNESQEQVRFVQAGDYLDIYFYENTLENQKDSNISPKKQKSHSQTEKNEEKKTKKLKIEEEETHQQPVSSPYKIRSNNSKVQFSLTFTHINPSIKEKLLNYLNQSISKKFEIQTKMYKNTISVYFQQKEDFEKYTSICLQTNHIKALQHFGYNNQIKIGVSTGHLHIFNYDKNKQTKFIYFLRNLIGQQLKEIEILKKGNRYVVDCKMISKEYAYEWLDKLLTNKKIKEFRLPGVQNGNVPKMKIFLECL